MSAVAVRLLPEPDSPTRGQAPSRRQGQIDAVDQIDASLASDGEGDAQPAYLESVTVARVLAR